MTYNDGVVWAGASDVWKSVDYGLTWSKTSCPAATVYRITFFNNRIGVVCVLDSGLFITNDGGVTWRRTLDTLGTYDAAFGVTADTIIVTLSVGNATSTDRGRTWKMPANSSDEQGPISSRDGIFYYKRFNHLFTSNNGGTSWTLAAGVSDKDCHSWAFDTCDRSAIYLVNEELYLQTDRVSAIYATHDLGATWRAVTVDTIGFYTGNIATSRSTLYVQTKAGVLRSWDGGVTWENFGLIPGQPDQQLLCVAADSVLLVCDESGYMWRRSDGVRGDPRSNHEVLLSPTVLYRTDDSLLLCQGPFVRSVSVGHLCVASSLLGTRISGFTNSNFSTSVQKTPSADLFTITFDPPETGYYSDTLYIDYPDTTFSILLEGQVLQAPPPELVGGDHTLFQRVRLTPCDRPVDSIIVINRYCKSIGISHMEIAGAGTASYSLSTITQGDRQFDSIVVQFKPSVTGLNAAALTIVYDDSTKIIVPLAGTTLNKPVVEVLAPRDTLFQGVAITPCDTAVRDIAILRGGCQQNLRSISITGLDAARFDIVRQVHDTSAKSDTVQLDFSILKPGQYKATLVFEYDDTTIRIPISASGIAGPEPFAVTGDTIFASRSLSGCDDPVDTLVLLNEGCIGRAVTTWQISGGDSSNYSVCCFAHADLLDTFHVSFRDSVLGSSHSSLIVRFDDGSVVTIPLGGYGKAASSPTVQTSRSPVFDTALYLCEAPVIDSVIIIHNCGKRTMLPPVIDGVDASNYTILSVGSDLFLGFDTIRLSFLPHAAGVSNARLTIPFSDGALRTVDLRGRGLSYSPAKLSLSDLSTDTIGSTIFVPITLSRDRMLSGISFLLHFDTSCMRFRGIRSFTTTTSHVVSQGKYVVVAIDLSSDKSDTILTLYAMFDWYPTPEGSTKVIADSIRTTSALAGCVVLANEEAEATVSGPYSCLSPLFIDALRYGSLPNVSIRPNPASRSICIRSPVPFDEVTIVDILGRVILRSSQSEIDVSELPQGLYNLSVLVAGHTIGRPLVIAR